MRGNLRLAWQVWFAFWMRVNRYWTARLAYLVVILGGVLTYWDSLDDYLPKRARGATYAALGILFLVLRARKDIKLAAHELRIAGRE